MDLLADHKQFIKSKCQDSKPKYWKIAKQKTQRSVSEISEILANISVTGGRALMPYRYLGLVHTPHISAPALTNVGLEFLSGSSNRKQAILDLQMLKLWLANPINRKNVGLDIFPAAFVIELLIEIGHLSFLEYASIVAWVDETDTISSIADRIRAFRSATEVDQQSAYLICETASEVQDFRDNVSRLYNFLFAGSYFQEIAPPATGEKEPSITLALNKETSRRLLEKFEILKSNIAGDYQTWDVTLPPSSLWNLDEIGDIETGDSELTDVIIVADESDENLPEPSDIPPIEKISPREIHVVLSRNIPISRDVIHNENLENKPKVDYVKKAIDKLASGLRAEEVVVEYEKRKLIKLGKPELAQKVFHLSAITDSQSYDVKSYDAEGNELHIEVKGVSRLTRKVSIFLTANEARRAQTDPQYRLVLVFDYWKIEPLVYEAEELLEVLREILDPSSIVGANAIATPVSWEILFDVQTK